MTEATKKVVEGEGGQVIYSSPPEQALNHVKQAFPEGLEDDARDGYEGIIVDADKLLEVARYLRDEAGFNYLSSITGVDLIE